MCVYVLGGTGQSQELLWKGNLIDKWDPKDTGQVSSQDLVLGLPAFGGFVF